jgi:hypothetical protein
VTPGPHSTAASTDTATKIVIRVAEANVAVPKAKTPMPIIFEATRRMLR